MAIIAPDIAIDLGTSNTQVYVKNKGIVLNEPTLMVVQDGKIIEQGTHQELLGKKGHYYRLYTRQYEDEATSSILS